MKALVLAVARIHGFAQVLFWIIARRIEYFFFSRAAHRRIRGIESLTHVVASKFVDAAEFSGMSWAIFGAPGYAMQPDGTRGLICWEATVGLTVYVNGEPSFGLGVDMFGNTLAIRQMQGVPMGRLPNALRAWPRLMVGACIEHASAAGLKEVRIYRADQSLFFLYPDLPLQSMEQWKNDVAKHQARMRRRYDQTAVECGFVPKGKRYLRWVNPNYGRS